jgi:hypothetical protein
MSTATGHRTWALCVSFALAIFAGMTLVHAGDARAATDEQLLAKFQPVTRAAPGEPFATSGVGVLVRDAVLETRAPDGTFVASDPAPTAATLPTADTPLCLTAGFTPCWRLNQQPCSPLQALGGLACYSASFTADDPDSVVYGRVAHAGNKTILQYWQFYYDDVYSYTQPPSDFIWQAHEGDWEVVNVVLSSRLRPLFVGYSQHCTGSRRAWAETPRLGTHPVDYVAWGSHANQFSPGTQPIATACIPPDAIALLEANHLPLPVDYTGDGEIAGPPIAGGTVTAIRRVGRMDPSWIRYPGAWGEIETLHAPAPIGTVVVGLGPTGPAFHRVWQHPLSTMAGWPIGS